MKRTRTQFPKHLQEIRTLMPELLHILEGKRTQDWYSFIWLEETKKIAVKSARNENTSESLDRGMVFRVLVDGINYEKSTNQLDRNNLINLVQDFRSELDDLFPKPINESYRPLSWSKENITTLGQDIQGQLNENMEASSEVHFSPMIEGNPFETKVSTFKEITSRIRTELLEKAHKNVVENSNFEELAEVVTFMRQEVITHIFVDREKNMSQTLPVTLLYSMGMTQKGQTGRCISGGLGGLEVAFHTDDDKEEVVLRPLQLANAKRLTPGRYKIISGPDVTGVIAHEAFGHTQEGDTWMKSRSIARDLYNSKTRVGNVQASIYNNPSMFSMENLDYGTNGSYFFDHEGQLGRPQKILDEGLLLEPMADLLSSIKLNIPRTANGKRESWRRPLMTRQTNTYFTPGENTLEELVAMVEEGFLARWANGGMEDPKGGSLTAGTSYFEEIKNGKLTGEYYLGPSGGHIEITDPVFTLLNKIVAKSKSVHDLNIPENKFGGCGKYHKEGVPAGCGGPYILWESINCG